ncbi:unnamed protein product [Anisakis simplex]|uniref:Serine protease K12H4.7 n=1 Tax=Anisakis simplex TaxID=6269 RepID=A0A0M3KCN8_ANISI|nr:unnamed protein product [Anisakis simplex]
MHQLSLTAEGRVELSKIFSLVPAWNITTKVNEKDMQNFFAIMYQNFDSIVQYNNDNRGIYAYGEGMREGCGIMQNNERTPMQNLAEVNKYVAIFPNGTFDYTDYVYQNLVKYLKNDTFFDGSDWRTWTYQTCTQFGFFESTDIGYNIWGSPVPVKRTHRLQGTNVMFTNGNIDPWHLQGKYNGTGTVTTILMNGTAHCAEMYPPRPQDAPDLKPVRELALKKIGEWLGKFFYS